MSDNSVAYHVREQRFLDAIALSEPDRVPILEPGTNAFPYHYSGYTMAEVVYDIEKAKSAIKKYLLDFDIDSGHTIGNCCEGQGLMLEKSRSKTNYWAGMPEAVIDENSIQQFIEFPLLEGHEYEHFVKDRTGTLLTRVLPRAYGVFEPLTKLNTDLLFLSAPNYGYLAGLFADPDFKSMADDLAELAQMSAEYSQQAGQLAAEVEEMGYPLMTGGAVIVSYDSISDFYRGTIGMSTDLYDYSDEVKQILDEHAKLVLAGLRARSNPNRLVFIPMHKGMDGFLSDEQYATYYWPYLMAMVNTIIDAGMIPYVYTEGPYTSRLAFLKQLPPGKCLVHFEGVDMALAKQELGDIACLTGNFEAHFLTYASKEQVIEKTKRLLDVVAPGGGYVFDFDGGLYNAIPENVAACFETIKEYGKY
ncbi:MAG: hypothetical protein LBG68_04225 [Coriobacteriales bacterium]|nr:hypothetical protein [Coriobacteriales bacterium]